MPAWLTVTAYGIAGAVVGAIGFSVLMLLLHALLWRQALNDGQYVLGFCVAPVPFGGVLGGVTGISWSLASFGMPTTAGWLCAITGALIGALMAAIVVGVRRNDEYREATLWTYLRFLVVPFYGPPFLSAIALVHWGVSLLRRS